MTKRELIDQLACMDIPPDAELFVEVENSVYDSSYKTINKLAVYARPVLVTGVPEPVYKMSVILKCR